MNLNKLEDRGNLWIKFEPEDFMDVYDEIDSNGELKRFRGKLKLLDSGRWHSSLSELHKAFAHMDYPARERFSQENPVVMKWIMVFAMAEELNQFKEFVNQ